MPKTMANDIFVRFVNHTFYSFLKSKDTYAKDVTTR